MIYPGSHVAEESGREQDNPQPSQQLQGHWPQQELCLQLGRAWHTQVKTNNTFFSQTLCDLVLLYPFIYSTGVTIWRIQYTYLYLKMCIILHFKLSRRNTSSLSWDIHRRLSLFWGQYHNYQIEKSCLKYVSHYYFHFTFCHVWLISGGEPGCEECGAGQQTQTGLLPQLPQLRPENNVPLVILRRKGAIKRAIKR